MSLDNSLGEGQTGLWFVRELVKLPPKYYPTEVIVHSHDFHPAREMVMTLMEHGIEARAEPFRV